MPPAKPKPSEIAAEAKKTYNPYIKQKYADKWPSESHAFVDPESQCKDTPNPGRRCRVAFIDGDPVDVALSWASDIKEGSIPVINMANESRPGGDWESSVVAPEENLCRRSNLHVTLINCLNGTNYPLPLLGGIYSPNVVVYRSGPEKYQLWQEMKALPIISVAPIRRPRLQEPAKQKYSFDTERNNMKDKIRSALRIAYYYDHENICVGAFGCGPVFRNPPAEIATMFRELLFFDSEFVGHFSNVVFAFDPIDLGTSNSKSSSSGSGSNSSGGSSGSSSSGSRKRSEMEIFREVMSPEKVFKNTTHR